MRNIGGTNPTATLSLGLPAPEASSLSLRAARTVCPSEPRAMTTQARAMLSRTLASVKRLPRISAVLTDQETFDFTCEFLADAIWLTSVAAMHDGIVSPLVWSASGAAPSRIESARASVNTTYRRLFVHAGDHSEPVGLDDTETLVTVPLGIPMLGVMRIESVIPLSDEERVFLRLVAILLGLSLARSFQLSPTEGRERRGASVA